MRVADQDKVTYLVDLSNMAYRNLYGMKLNTTEGSPSGHIFGTIRSLIKMRTNPYKYSLVFALDYKPTRKIGLDPTYKANRKRDEEQFNPVPDIQKLVKYISCRCIWSPGEEADDVICSYIHKNPNENIIVVSSDADLYQLIERGRVRQLNPMDGRIISSEELMDKFGLSSFDKVPLWKSIFGDSGDNVKPPIPRLRKKELVPYIEQSDGTIDGFWRQVLGSGDDKLVVKFSPEEVRKRAELNFDLVKLKGDIQYQEKMYFGNRSWLTVFLRKFDCISLINGEMGRLFV